MKYITNVNKAEKHTFEQKVVFEPKASITDVKKESASHHVAYT